MPTSPITIVNERLRRALLLHDGARRSDGDLLGRLIDHRDEAALAILVQRHGPMVWGTCRRLLNHHDAEDAFQATFIVFVRKAASVVPREMVGNWLYGVAHRSALQAKRTATRRRAREVQVTEMPDTAAVPQDHWPDVLPLLDEELSRLPDNYRAVIVLCDLEGRTRKEVAHQLGCPEGTVAGRLARARTMLAKRLARRGVTLSGGVLAAMLAQNAASAVVPAAVVSNTIGAATSVAAGQVAMAGVISVEVATLTEGVLKAMLIGKLKTLAIVVLAVCALGTGAGILTQPMAAAGPQEVRRNPVRNTEIKVKAPVPKFKEDQEMLQGTWYIETAGASGKHHPNDTSEDQIWVFTDDKLAIDYADGSRLEMTYRLDPKPKPKAIDVFPTNRKKGYTFKGMYEIDGDQLKIYNSWNAEYPTKFEPHDKERGGKWFVLRRAFTAWGKEVGGLQAGLGFRIGDQRLYRHGETVTMAVRVRNVGKEVVKFEYVKQFLEENPPTVTAADGKELIQEIVSILDLKHISVEVGLNPGQEIQIESRPSVPSGRQYEFVPVGGKAKSQASSLVVGTGKVTLRYEQVFGNSTSSNMKLDPTLSKLATGKLELEIKAAAPDKK